MPTGSPDGTVRIRSDRSFARDMDLLAALHAFTRVAESGSFSAVAREMGTTQPAVSRQVAALEDHLGARLLQRTTRSLTLTEDGRDLLGHAARVLEAVSEAEAAIGRGRAEPVGLVRIGSSVAFGRLYLAPRMGILLDRHPQLQVELSLTDAVVDLVHDGLDMSVRVGEVADQTLIARRIGSAVRQVVASADYLARRGEPQHPSELVDHECIIFTRRANAVDWRFDGPDGACTVRVSGRFRSDSGEAVREAVLAGIGISVLPAWLFPRAIVSGAVRPILTAWASPSAPIQAVYPSRRHLAPRTRAVIDFLVEQFSADPVISPSGASADDPPILLRRAGEPMIGA